MGRFFPSAGAILTTAIQRPHRPTDPMASI
ncbi:hypothetical protein RLEG12_18435 [Rhizobium leguminosarum bv. trifolii CB782]|nr:hypothetical protein RLEG12_18435 [Rhizobium leguminosarum bv. trifolii CB782]